MKPTRSISRFPRAFRLLLAGLVAGACLLAGPVSAQVATPVLTIDWERLLNETRQGALLRAKLDREAQELAAEHLRIRNELAAEERELTDRRAELSPEEFRDLANAFDARVQRLRAETDEKERLLSRAADEARLSFFRDVIADIARARGAFVVLNSRDVLLFANAVDITDEAIRRINQMADEETE
ncbi:MAG: OmpH family outer membrane protein [Boseongicola sp. SB0662_bin_57]|nr:OmpH family outer membrane protein [Boseongicola sp. SB0662_bin_57]